MSDPQQQLDLNQIIAAAVGQQVGQQLSNPAILSAISAVTMRHIGNTLVANSWAGSIDANLFLTKIRKLKKISLALMTQWMVVPMAWRLLAEKKADGTYALYVFRINEGDTTKSDVSDLLDGEDAQEQRTELIRQLEAIKHEGIRLYTVLAIDQEIKDYAYFEGEVIDEAKEVVAAPASAAEKIVEAGGQQIGGFEAATPVSHANGALSVEEAIASANQADATGSAPTPVH